MDKYLLLFCPKNLKLLVDMAFENMSYENGLRDIVSLKLL
jgi:hypothetical protein